LSNHNCISPSQHWALPCKDVTPTQSQHLFPISIIFTALTQFSSSNNQLAVLFGGFCSKTGWDNRDVVHFALILIILIQDWFIFNRRCFAGTVKSKVECL